MKITKAVIPLGGYATRFLPASKSVPKEMFAVVDKPILQYLVEELSNAGITDILFLIGRGKEAILNHFDKNPELDNFLIKNNKLDLLEKANSSCNLAKLHYLRCYEANGVAKALLLAENFVGDSPFIVAFGDEMFYSSNISATQQIIEEYNKTDKSIIGCVNVKREEVSSYGVIDIEEKDGVKFVRNMVEKPKVEDAPSTLIANGKYLLTPNIFKYIKENKVLDREKNFTEALIEVAKKDGLVAKQLDGVRYDTGSKVGYILANVFYALKDEEINKKLKSELKELLK